MQDTYKIIVEFSRSIADDSGVLEKEPAQITPGEYAEQFNRELQGAYDELAMAGHYLIQSVQVAGVNYVPVAKNPPEPGNPDFVPGPEPVPAEVLNLMADIQGFWNLGSMADYFAGRGNTAQYHKIKNNLGRVLRESR